MIPEEFKRWRVVPERLAHWARTRSDDPFVRCGGDWLTFSELDRQAGVLAAALAARGIGKGDRVATVMPNRVEMIVTVFALAKLGAILVPVNVFLKGEFLRYQLHDSEAVALVADAAGVAHAVALRAQLPALHTVVLVGDDDRGVAGGAIPFSELLTFDGRAPEASIVPSDLICILYTSGTTGMPKGCMLSHGYFMSSTWGWYENDWYRPDDRLVTAMPLFHIGGLGVSLMGALLGGLAISFETSFSASNFIAQVRNARATVAYGVGPMAMAMLASPEQPSERDHDLRLAAFIPMAPAAHDAFEARFGVPMVTEAYGQTEGTPVMMSPRTEHRKQRGCLGRPVAQFEVQVVDDNDDEVPVGQPGELLVRPSEPNVMFSGYWRKPDITVETFRNLWHHTGDVVRRDGDGYYTLLDRKKDSIRRRGENISSMEVEAAIAAHPKVAAAVVHGVPSAMGDEDVKAWLVLQPGQAITPEELYEFFCGNLPYFAVPRYVQVVHELPVNAMGRVQKFELRKAGHEGAWDFEELNLVVGKAQRR